MCLRRLKEKCINKQATGSSDGELLSNSEPKTCIILPTSVSLPGSTQLRVMAVFLLTHSEYNGHEDISVFAGLIPKKKNCSYKNTH